MAHNWLELYIRAILAKNEEQQKILLERKCTDERATNCVNAALDWMQKHNVRWVETERKIYSLEHNFAGTMDGLAIVDSCSDPTCCGHAFKDRLSVIDWKSSNYLYLEYLLQTAAYQLSYSEETGAKIEDRWICRLGKEQGEFDAWHCAAEDFPLDKEAFLTCLKLFNVHTQIEERMRVQKKFIKALKKEAKMKAKQLAKEQDKLQKAMEKAERKRIEKEEKEKIKAEAKLRREQEKAAKKTKVLAETKAEPIRRIDAGAEGSRGIPGERTGVHEVASEKEKEVPTVQTADSDQQLNAPSVVLSKTLECRETFFEEEPETKRSLIPEE